MNKGNMDLKTFLKQEMNKVKETNKVNHFQPNKIIKKKKFSLNEKLKPFFKFLNGLKNKLFGSLIKWNKERIKLKEEVRLAKEVKRDFKKTFGVSSESVVKLIKKENLNGHPIEQTDKSHHIDALITGREKINKNYRPNRAPLFYDPEICDIHNENEFKWSSYPIEEIIKRENISAVKELDKVNHDKKINLINKVKVLLRTRM